MAQCSRASAILMLANSAGARSMTTFGSAGFLCQPAGRREPVGLALWLPPVLAASSGTAPRLTSSKARAALEAGRLRLLPS
jgi:hypothetical protein